MKYDEQVDFLKRLQNPRLILGFPNDLSKHPEWFGKPIRVRGLHIHTKAYSADSKTLGALEVELILYNETFKENVSVPEGFMRVRVCDDQGFVYQAAFRIPPPPKRFPWLDL